MKKNIDVVETPIGSQSNRPSRQQALRDCYARTSPPTPHPECVCVVVYEFVEPEQASMFTGELIQ